MLYVTLLILSSPFVRNTQWIEKGVPMEIIQTRVRNENDLSSMEKDWRRLSAGNEMTVFQSYEWNRLLVKEWRGQKAHVVSGKCMVYAAKEEDNIMMILPVVIQSFSTKTKWFGKEKGIYILGNGSYSDYLNLIYSDFDPVVFEKLYQRIKGDYPGYPLYITDVREDTSFCRYLQEKGVSPDKEKISVAVKRKDSIDDYTLSLSRQTKQNLRTSLNRMNRDGVVYRYEILGKMTDDGLMGTLIDIHTSRLINKLRGNAEKAGNSFSTFRKWVLKYKEKKNVIQYSMKEMDNSCIVVVYLNDVVAGYLYGLRDKQSIRIMQNCFDETYKFYSPLFRAAYDFIVDKQYENENVPEIDFTRGNEDYKYRLGGEETKLYHFVL